MSECIERRLKTAGTICDHGEHTHPERSPKEWELDFEGCVRLLRAMCVGMSDGSRAGVAAFFTGKTTREIRDGQRAAWRSEGW